MAKRIVIPSDQVVSAVINAVKPGLVIQRTFGKHLDDDEATQRFNEQLEDELNELSERNMCGMISGTTKINWMSIPQANVQHMDSYSKYVYYSCRIHSMRKASITSDLILHSLSKDFKFLGAGDFGTVSSSQEDTARRGTTGEIVMKSSTDDRSPADLIHELFIATYLNQLADLGIPNYIMMYGYTASCNTPFIMEDGRINTGCERQGPRANILMEKINTIGSFGEFVRDHITGKKLIASTEEEATSIVMELFLQIFAALSVAQKLMKFNHLDLHVGNILIVDMGTKVSTKYQMSDRMITIRSRYRPIIIDFGMARISINCKLYINRSIDHIAIAKTDLLEGAFIPWYDTHRMLSSMTAYIEFFKPRADSLVYNMICYLYTLNLFEKPDMDTQVGQEKLPTALSTRAIIIDSVELARKRIEAIDSINHMKQKGNMLWQSSMADYDINTPECMVRMMTTRRGIYQFLQSNVVYGDKGTLYNMITPIIPNFGSQEEVTPRTLIDLKMFILDRIKSARSEVQTKADSLKRWKGLIAGSIRSFVDMEKSVLNKSANGFDITIGIISDVSLADLTNYAKGVDYIYDYQSAARQVVNYRREIIDFLRSVDPSFFTAADLNEFDALGGRLIGIVNNFFTELKKQYSESLSDLEKMINNDSFMNSIKIVSDHSRLMIERQKIRDGRYNFENFFKDILLRNYYRATYMQLYANSLGSYNLFTKSRMLKLGTLLDVIVDQRVYT